MVHTVYFFVRKDSLQNAKHCYTTVFINMKVVYKFVLTITMLRSGIICFWHCKLSARIGKADNQLGYLRLQERPEQQKSLADWWGSGYSRPQNFPFHNRRLRTLWHSPHAVWWQGWNPGCLLYKKGIVIRKNKKEFTHPFSWSGYVVRSILAKQEYCGDTVNFRTHKESYKDKSSVKNPQENWLIFNDTHEAIIDRETWELAQKLTKTPRRVDTTGVANPLTGLVYCADCGAKMYNHRFFRAYYADDKWVYRQNFSSRSVLYWRRTYAGGWNLSQFHRQVWNSSTSAERGRN